MTSEIATIPNDVNLQALTSADAASTAGAIEVFGRTLGADQARDDEVRRIAARSQAGRIFCATAGTGVVGAISVRILGREWPEEVPAGLAGRYSFPDALLGEVSSLAVLSGYRGQGVGGRLVHDGCNWLWSAGCTTIIAFSWVSNHDDSSRALFLAHGFVEAGVIKQYYRKLREQRRFECPRCGPDCTCDAILMVRERSY